jgi:hypothetical protein
VFSALHAAPKRCAKRVRATERASGRITGNPEVIGFQFPYCRPSVQNRRICWNALFEAMIAHTKMALTSGVKLEWERSIEHAIVA